MEENQSRNQTELLKSILFFKKNINILRIISLAFGITLFINYFFSLEISVFSYKLAFSYPGFKSLSNSSIFILQNCCTYSPQFVTRPVEIINPDPIRRRKYKRILFRFRFRIRFRFRKERKYVARKYPNRFGRPALRGQCGIGLSGDDEYGPFPSGYR